MCSAARVKIVKYIEDFKAKLKMISRNSSIEPKPPELKFEDVVFGVEDQFRGY